MKKSEKFVIPMNLATTNNFSFISKNDNKSFKNFF